MVKNKQTEQAEQNRNNVLNYGSYSIKKNVQRTDTFPLNASGGELKRGKSSANDDGRVYGYGHLNDSIRVHHDGRIYCQGAFNAGGVSLQQLTGSDSNSVSQSLSAVLPQ